MRNRPTLRRFDITVYRNLSPSDPAQVPASAAIDFYKQGATVRIGRTIGFEEPQPEPVPIWHPGAIVWFDPPEKVSVNGGGYELDVSAVDTDDAENMTITLINTTELNGIPIADNERLVWLYDRPIVHLEPIGREISGANSISTDPAGRAVCYIREPRFDYVVRIDGLVARVFVDAEGSFVL